MQTALTAKAALLVAGVAVDKHAKVRFECDAREAYESSPWMMHKEAAEVVRSAPVQSSDNVPPSCVARVMASHHAECRWAGIWYNLDCHAQVPD